MTQLILVHGFLGSSLNWAPVISKLSLPLGLMGVKCQSVNLLWHSKRPGPSTPENFDLNIMTEDLLSQITKAPGERVIGLGHSFGLRPLLRASKLYPDFFDALLVEDSSPEMSETGFKLLNRIFDEVPTPFENRESARLELQKIFGADSQMARFLMSNLSAQNDGRQNWRFNAEALHKILEKSFEQPLWQEWSDFSKPIHMILGGDSKFVVSERLEKCLELGAVHGRSVSKVLGAGHWVHADKLDVFCDEVQKALESWIV